MPVAEKTPSGLGTIQINAGLIGFLAMVLIIIVAVHQHLESQFDFGVFYYAAHMITGGSRHDIYNFAVQHSYQLRFHRPPDTLFRYPPIALIPILPLSILPMPAAFAAWTAISMALVIMSLKILEKETHLHFGNWPVLLGLLFVPILDCMMHGQYSILIMAVYVIAYAQWKRGRRFLAGAVLALATLKFQLVLGFVPILLLKRKWRELAGFSAISALLVIISLAMTGLYALEVYPNFALHAELPISELSHKANWQGLLSLIGKNDSIWVALLSIVTVIWAARAWTNLDRGFCAAILASMLVSYHITPQDLSVVVVPFYVAANAGILPRNRVPLFAGIGMGILMLFVFFQIPIAFVAVFLVLSLAWVGTHPGSVTPAVNSSSALAAT